MLDHSHCTDDGNPTSPCDPNGSGAHVPPSGCVGEDGSDAGCGVWGTTHIGVGCRREPARPRGIWHTLAAAPRAAGEVGRGNPVTPLSLVWPRGTVQQPL